VVNRNFWISKTLRGAGGDVDLLPLDRGAQARHLDGDGRIAVPEGIAADDRAALLRE
jgi:hypothetical protein